MEALNHTSCSTASLTSSSFHCTSMWRRQPKQYSPQKSKTLQRPHCSNRSASQQTYLLNIWKKFQLQSTHKRHVAWLYLDGIVYEDGDLHTHNDLSSYFAYITERTCNMWPASQGRIIPLFLLCHVQPHYLVVKGKRALWYSSALAMYADWEFQHASETIGEPPNF